jgi:hypothetical protein
VAFLPLHDQLNSNFARKNLRFMPAPALKKFPSALFQKYDGETHKKVTRTIAWGRRDRETELRIDPCAFCGISIMSLEPHLRTDRVLALKLASTRLLGC